MDLFAPSLSPAALPDLSEEAVRVRMMRELFKRTRESALVGILPVLLILWAHWNAQPRSQLLGWAAAALVILGYRVLIAHLYLAQPQAQVARQRRWFALEWLGSVSLAALWVSSISLLGTGQVDGLFIMRLIFIVALAAFLLSALGMALQLYASVMAVIVAGTLALLHRDYPGFVQELQVVDAAFVAYAVMLLVRSRGEHHRTREWVRARLAQRLLLDQLNQTIQQELLMHETLRLKSRELEQSNQRLAELAIHDGLTGAFRRGHIESELQRQIMAWERHANDFSVLLLDVDHFKRVNDDHGHAVGDDVLRQLVVVARQTLRGSDLFGRWGGEEFIALLADTPLPQALEAAERLRQAIRDMDLRSETGQRFHITVSIGVAQLAPGETAELLAQRADQAMYAAKHAGRDRVMTHEPGRSLTAPPV